MSYPANQNLALLQQGIDVLQELPSSFYGTCPAGRRFGCVGKHVRHILNFYECFLEGMSQGVIDYDARRRDAVVESDRETAIGRMRETMDLLRRIAWQRWDEPVRVKQNESEDSELEGAWCSSTVGREMQALVSHTVHHYAIISCILRVAGIECPAEFGVAPSTLNYRRSLQYAAARQ